MNEREKQRQADALIEDARAACIVTPGMVARATGLQIPLRLVWCAAGAGLAEYHKSVGRVHEDIRSAFGGDADQLPKAYYDGYKLEILRADYQLA